MATLTLPEFTRALRKRYGDAAPNYRRLYNDILDGKLAAERGRKVWTLRADQIEEVGRAYKIHSGGAA